MTVRFKGQDIDLGGTTYVVPPLALGDVKELLPRIQKVRAVEGLPTAEDIDTMVEVLQAALRRNYPEITQADLLPLIDLGNVRQLFRSVMGMSGLEKTEPSEGNASAEATRP